MRAIFRVYGNESQPGLQLVENLATPVQGLTLDLSFVWRKIYYCDCCEFFNVHCTFSRNLEAESVSKQVETSHADFLRAYIMNAHAGGTRDHTNFGVTKRGA